MAGSACQLASEQGHGEKDDQDVQHPSWTTIQVVAGHNEGKIKHYEWDSSYPVPWK
jgi:hypothetical protein